MSNRLEVSRQTKQRQFFSLIVILMLAFWGLLFQGAPAQQITEIKPPRTGVNVRSDLTLLFNPEVSKYEVDFKLLCPDPGKATYICRGQWVKPLELEVITNVPTLERDHRSGLLTFRFTQSVHFRLLLSLKNRFLDLSDVVFTLTQAGENEFQSVTIHPQIFPPRPDFQLRGLNEPHNFTLNKKGGQQTFTLVLEGANALEDNEKIDLSITSDPNSVLQFSSTNSGFQPSLTTEFSKAAASRAITIAFPPATSNGKAKINISSVLYPKLNKKFEVDWKVEETSWLNYFLVAIVLAIGSVALAVFLKSRKQKNPVLTRRRIPNYSEPDPPRADVEINVSPEELFFEKTKTEVKEFTITGTSRKPLEFTIGNMKGLTIKNEHNREVGYNGSRITLSEISGGYFDTTFKVVVLNPAIYSRQLNLQFFEKNTRNLQSTRTIKISLEERRKEPPAEPPPNGQFLKQVEHLNSRIDVLEEKLSLAKEAQTKDVDKKIEALAKSSELKGEIRRQVFQEIKNLPEEIKKELAEQLWREFSAKSQRAQTQRPVSDSRHEPIIIDKQEHLPVQQQAPIPPPQDREKPSELDVKIANVVEALIVVQSELNDGRSDELILRAIELFNKLLTPATAPSGNAGAPRTGGLTNAERLAMAAEAKARAANQQAGNAAPPPPISPADFESRFDGLVKGQILPIIEKFDKSPDAPEMPFALQTLADVCGLEEMKLRRNDELDGTFHDVLRRENGPDNKIIRVTKRGFLYKNALAKKAEVIIGNGLQ